MKTILKILLALILLTALCFSAFSQSKYEDNSNKKSEKIETGHVFIDGKYIKPPYVVKRKGSTILINGNIVFDYQIPDNPFNFKGKPVTNFDVLHKDSNLDEISNIKDTAYDKPFANVLS